MAIPVTCGCGQVIDAKDEHAGRRIRCRACGKALTVPDADDQTTAFDTDPEPLPVAPSWRLPDFSLSRILLGPIALVSGFLAIAGTFAAARTPEGIGLIWIIFTVALAGLAASRPRR